MKSSSSVIQDDHTPLWKYVEKLEKNWKGRRKLAMEV